MIRHNWQYSGYAISLNAIAKNIIDVCEVSNLEHGTYMCSRCGENAFVYTNHITFCLSGISFNWNEDCDESIIRKIHES